MNSQIKDKELKTRNDDGKNHQAYAMELSRLKRAKSICEETENCNDYNTLGGENRFNEIKSLVDKEREINHSVKKTGMDAGRENQFQKAKNGTEVSVPMVTKSADHSGKSVTNKIMSNDQALKSKKNSNILSNNEALREDIKKEIDSIRYLIEYMNNNNNKQQI